MPIERPNFTNEQPTEKPLFLRGKERITNPELALVQVTEIKGVPGVKYDIAVVRDPYHSALGGWRIAPAERLVDDYRKAKEHSNDYVSKIMHGRGIPDETAAAGVLESFQLAGEMSQKWAGMRSTMRYGMNPTSNVYGEHQTEMLANRDAWIEASTMDGGTKGILVVTDKKAYDNITHAQKESLLKQHADHMKELNKRKPTDAAEDVAYYTAPDMGSSEAMMDKIYEETEGKFVACYSEHNGGTGNPSPTTALGVAYGIRGVNNEILLNNPTGCNMSLAVQGAAGEVGSSLVKFIRSNHPNADIFVSDTAQKRKVLEQMTNDEQIKIADGDDIFRKGTIFVPSGPPAQLNDETFVMMRDAGVKAVVGPANYLYTSGEEDELAEKFKTAGIIVAPAPLVNQGGIRSILPQFVEKITGRRPNQEIAHKSVADVEPMTVFVLQEALVRGVTPEQVFQELAYGEYAKQSQKKRLI